MTNQEKILAMVISGQTRAKALAEEFTELRLLIEGGVSTSPKPERAKGLTAAQRERLEMKLVKTANRRTA